MLLAFAWFSELSTLTRLVVCPSAAAPILVVASTPKSAAAANNADILETFSEVAILALTFHTFR